MRLRRILPAVALAALLVGAAGCASDPAPAPSQPETAPTDPGSSADGICEQVFDGDKVVLTVSNVIEGFAPLLIAMESGAFEEVGLDVTVEKISASDSLAQIAQGRLDGQLTSYSFGNLNAAASDVEMLWVVPFYEIPANAEGALPGYWARTEIVGDGAQPDLAALRGQTIMSPTGGSGAGGMVLNDALNTVDMTIDDITFATGSGGDALIAVENGAVAGAWLSAPFTQTAAENPDLRLAATYEPGLNGSGIIVGPSLLDRPDVLTKLLQVLAETNEEYLQGNYYDNAVTMEYLSAALDQPEELIRGGVPFVFDPTLSMDGAAGYVEALQEFGRTYGGLDYAENLPADRLVATEFAARAASCLG